jgi:hypothetical protein
MSTSTRPIIHTNDVNFPDISPRGSKAVANDILLVERSVDFGALWMAVVPEALHLLSYVSPNMCNRGQHAAKLWSCIDHYGTVNIGCQYASNSGVTHICGVRYAGAGFASCYQMGFIHVFLSERRRSCKRCHSLYASTWLYSGLMDSFRSTTSAFHHNPSPNI